MLTNILKSITLVLLLLIVQINAQEGGETKHDSDSGSENNVILGFCLVLFGATLSTLGSMILYIDNLIKYLPFVKKDVKLSTSKPFLASSLSFSAGVLMVTIFNNVLPEGLNAFHTSNFFGQYAGLIAAFYFLFCMALVILTKYFFKRRNMQRGKRNTSDIGLNPIDSRVSSPRTIVNPMDFNNNNSHNSSAITSPTNSNFQHIIEINSEEGTITEIKEKEKEKDIESCPTATTINNQNDNVAKNIGYEIALGIAIHNFPEGVLTFVASYQSMKTGLLFGVALALHKFPEGIMIGVPIFASTGSKLKACLITAAASFITQLLGAGFAYGMFHIYWNDIIGGLLFLLASAILISTLLGGMLPLAKSYDQEDRYSTIWMSIGIVVFIFLTSVIADK
ncbi:hypothetical protein K502DRAFT_299217 [Neoconidiobolus thromboides FSU 785]|nr:hypothetical protein K502DRAFT_299217 [Neoconidiobolus thromboides FSU 785]